MRYAVLSDVHANLHALEAVLDAARLAGVDRYVCAGDMIGYGAHPAQCVSLLREIGAACVAGNHELMVLGVLGEQQAGGLARAALDYTRAALDEETRGYLATLPLRLELPGLVVAHGSTDDPQEYVRSAERADVLLASLPDDVRGLVLGHTHQPWVRALPGGTRLQRSTGTARVGTARFLVNPGSVGQSRSSRWQARFAVVDVADGDVVLHEVAYDRAAARAALVDAGLPPDSYHCRTPLTRRVAGRLKRAWTGDGRG